MKVPLTAFFTASALVLGGPAAAQDDANVTIVNPTDESGAAAGAAEAAQNAGEATEDAAAAAGAAIDGAADATSDAADATVEAVDEAAETAQDPTTGADVTIVDGDEMVEQGTPIEGQLFTADPSDVMASALLGASVTNDAGETVGDIDDVIMTPAGEVKAVVIGVGGFLGIGQKRVAVRYDRIDVAFEDEDRLAVLIDATADELEAAPDFRTPREIEDDVEAVNDAGGGVGTSTTTQQ